MVRIGGVDDAGRGSMLGPLVIAGVSVEKRNLRRLAALGVRDSKLLSPKRRQELYGPILELADSHHIARIRPRTIDAGVREHKLNELEARYMARVVARLAPDASYVDSCDVNPARFGRAVSAMAGGAVVRSYHRADSRFAVVSAASIIAKVARDRAIERLSRSHDVGSGYPSDPRAVAFVRGYHAEHGSLPPFVRRSWRPVRRVTGE